MYKVFGFYDSSQFEDNKGIIFAISWYSTSSLNGNPFVCGEKVQLIQWRFQELGNILLLLSRHIFYRSRYTFVSYSDNDQKVLKIHFIVIQNAYASFF